MQRGNLEPEFQARRWNPQRAPLNSFVVPVFPITAIGKPRESSARAVPPGRRTTPRMPSLNERERLVIDMDRRCLASPDKDYLVRIAHDLANNVGPGQECRMRERGINLSANSNKVTSEKAPRGCRGE